jgi:dCMP deaminase
MHKVFSKIVEEVATMSKCQFLQVGCLAVDDSGRIKATGVNGTPSGLPNCCDLEFETRDHHGAWANDYEIHAEMNMIEDLARSGYKPFQLTIYVTHSPCKNCLKHLIGLMKRSGHDMLMIDKIIFNKLYWRYTEVDLADMKQYCANANVKLLSIEEIQSEL